MSTPMVTKRRLSIAMASTSCSRPKKKPRSAASQSPISSGNGDLIQTSEVETILGVTRQRLHQLIAEGYLSPVGKREGGTGRPPNLFRRGDVDEYLRRRNGHFTLLAPVRTWLEMNERVHWAVKKRSFDDQRREVWASWVSTFGQKRQKFDFPMVIRLTRISQKLADSDNIASGMKGIRDELARLIGFDDGDPRVRWEYKSEAIGKRAYMVKIEIFEKCNPEEHICLCDMGEQRSRVIRSWIEKFRKGKDEHGVEFDISKMKAAPELMDELKDMSAYLEIILLQLKDLGVKIHATPSV